MKSPKTSLMGIIGGVLIILTQVYYMFDMDPSTVFSVEAIMAALATMGIGYFARDNDVSSEQAGAK